MGLQSRRECLVVFLPVFASIPRRFLSMGTSLVGRIVAVSIRHSLIVLLATLAATAAALVYLAQNFAMSAETSQLISPKLEWRKRGSGTQACGSGPAGGSTKGGSWR